MEPIVDLPVSPPSLTKKRWKSSCALFDFSLRYLDVTTKVSPKLWVCYVNKAFEICPFSPYWYGHGRLWLALSRNLVSLPLHTSCTLSRRFLVITREKSHALIHEWRWIRGTDVQSEADYPAWSDIFSSDSEERLESSLWTVKNYAHKSEAIGVWRAQCL